MRQILGVLGGFFAGGAVAGVVTAAVTFHLLARIDPSLGPAPGEELEVEAALAAMLAFFGSLILALVAMIWRVVRPTGALRSRRPASLGLAAGALYIVLPWSLGRLFGGLPEQLPVAYCGVLWLYVLGYPAGAFWLALRGARP